MGSSRFLEFLPFPDRHSPRGHKKKRQPISAASFLWPRLPPQAASPPAPPGERTLLPSSLAGRKLSLRSGWHSSAAGAGVAGCWRRWVFSMDTGAVNRAPTLSSGAGPPPKNPPAPRTPYTCAKDPLHLHQGPRIPAPRNSTHLHQPLFACPEVRPERTNQIIAYFCTSE